MIILLFSSSLFFLDMSLAFRLLNPSFFNNFILNLSKLIYSTFCKNTSAGNILHIKNLIYLFALCAINHICKSVRV